LLRTDLAGTVQPGWPKMHGAPSPVRTTGGIVERTRDGGYAMAATETNGSSSQGFLYRFDSQGGVLAGWPKAVYQSNGFFSMQQTSDGGFVAIAYNKPLFIFRSNAEGAALLGWPKILAGTELVTPKSILQTYDGGFIIFGNSIPAAGGINTNYLLKTDSQGGVLPGWPKSYSGTGYSICKVSDGGFVLVGSIANPRSDIHILRVDAQGTPLPGWPKTFGGVNLETGYSVQQTSDGGFIVAGTSLSSETKYESVFLLKIDANGNAD
jgi:hypothetical protein